MSEEKHFLDTNIILSIIIEDTEYDICFKYFKKACYEKIISSHVKKEGEEIISYIKLISIVLLEYIKNYVINKEIRLINIERELYKIKKSFINSYKDISPFKEKSDKFIDIVNDLFEEFDELMQNSLFDNKNLDILDKNIDTIANREHKFLNCISYLTIYNFESSSSDKKRIDSLINNGNHKEDAIILNDAYKASKVLDAEIYFITNDTGILSLYNEINTVLNSKVHVHNPSTYI